MCIWVACVGLKLYGIWRRLEKSLAFGEGGILGVSFAPNFFLEGKAQLELLEGEPVYYCIELGREETGGSNTLAVGSSSWDAVIWCRNLPTR